MDSINRDVRLETAYQLIDAGNIKCLSLDIFDTLLWRKVPVPADLFLILGYQLKKEGWLIPAVPPEGFVELRTKAEQIARFKKRETTTEVTLQEIYWALSGIFTKITIDEMIAGKKGITSESDINDLVLAEIQLEKQILRYDENIIALIQYAVSKKIPVVLISNTYFSEETIREFVSNVLPFIQKLFISCEYGIKKDDGLFAKMLEELQVLPQDVLHIGDNYQADIQGAKKFGISALFYQKTDEEFTQILNCEWPTNDPALRCTHLDSQQGDFGLTSLRAKIRFESGQSSFFWQYGASVLGPCLTGFTHWVYDRCKNLKESKVFCLMREGRLYNNLIKEYAPYYPSHKLETAELWGSRQFVTHACVFHGTAQEIFAVTKSHPASRFTYESFLAYLGLDIEEIDELVQYKHVELDEPDIRIELANFLSQNEALRGKIVQFAEKKRKRFLKYLSNLIDLNNTTHITLVDVGWSGTIQGALQAILLLSGYSIQVHGLYLCTTHDTELALMQGFTREGYLSKMNYPYCDVQVIKRGMYAMEQTSIAGLGALVDIDEAGHVLTATPSMSQEQMQQARTIQEGILAFSNCMGKFVLKNGWNSSSDALIHQLRGILVRATGWPTKAEANSFETWSHDHISLQDSSRHALGKSNYYEEFIKDMLPKWAFEDWGMTWPFVYAAKTSKTLTETALVGRSEIIPPECFLSIDAIPLRVYIDHGEGFSTKAEKELLLRSNANRKFYAFDKLFSIHAPIKKIRLEIDLPNSYIKMASLRLTTQFTNSPAKELHTFFENGSTNKDLICSLSQEIPHLFLTQSSPLTLTYSFNNPNIYQIYLNFCFGIL